MSEPSVRERGERYEREERKRERERELPGAQVSFQARLLPMPLNANAMTVGKAVRLSTGSNRISLDL